MTENELRPEHAPTYLREAFCDWIDQGRKGETVEIEGEQKTVKWLFVQLWNCANPLPAKYCDNLDIPRGSTYATAARKLRAESSY